MISEGLCDTEDWSNDAENSANPDEVCDLSATKKVTNTKVSEKWKPVKS